MKKEVKEGIIACVVGIGACGLVAWGCHAEYDRPPLKGTELKGVTAAIEPRFVHAPQAGYCLTELWRAGALRTDAAHADVLVCIEQLNDGSDTPPWYAVLRRRRDGCELWRDFIPSINSEADLQVDLHDFAVEVAADHRVKELK